MSDDLEVLIRRLEKQLQLAEGYSVRAFWQALDRAYEACLATRDIRCIVCDYTDRRSGFRILTEKCMFGGGELERYTCPQCDCVFGPQKYLDLDDSFVDLDYRLLYSRYSESDSTADEIKTFQFLNPKRGRLYLDWGCGGSWSKTISRLREQEYDVWGYEPSAEVAGDFVVNQRGAITARFDGIFSNNVIEHFRDPVAQFRDFHGILRDGGAMAHSSPCYEYNYAFTRFHTIFLTGRSPDILAERTGFKVIDRIQDREYINVVFVRL